MMGGRRLCLLAISSLAVLLSPGLGSAQQTFSAAGSAIADIQAQVDAFRFSLGTLNPNVAGSFGFGRREINWDGVPDNFSAPNLLPANFFNVNSPRGVVFSTPGSGFQVSANAGIGPVEFGNIDPAYPAFFAPFSPQKLFTALGSNIVDVSFFVPGTSTAALTRGFGAIFSDVDVANITSITIFGPTNELLGTFFVPPATGNGTLSLLGLDFGSLLVSHVRITSGNQILSPGSTLEDLVVMDDFIYGEPVGFAAIPGPIAGAGIPGLVIAFAGALAWWRRSKEPDSGLVGSGPAASCSHVAASCKFGALRAGVDQLRVNLPVETAFQQTVNCESPVAL